MKYTLIEGKSKIELTFTNPVYNRALNFDYDIICQKTKANIKMSNEARQKLKMIVGDKLAFFEHNKKIILVKSQDKNGIELKPVKGSTGVFFVYNRVLWEKLGMTSEKDPIKYKLGESAKFEISENEFLFGYYLDKI